MSAIADHLSLLTLLYEQSFKNVRSNFAGSYVSTKSAAGGSWAAHMATPTMRRAHSQDSASSIIFVDSTSSCDVSKTTATVLLTATKAGCSAHCRLAAQLADHRWLRLGLLTVETAIPYVLQRQ